MGPVFLMLALVTYFQNGSFFEVTTYSILTTTSVAFAFMFLHFCKNLETTMSVSFDNISVNDNYLGYLFAYGFPLLTTLFNFEVIMDFIIILVVISILFISNASMPNIVLRLFGFHFYVVGVSGGLQNYTLMTKNDNIRKSDTVIKVREVVQFMLIDFGDKG